MLDEALAGLAPTHVWVAYSGGADSSALLVLAREWGQARNVPVRAVHVNHGLHSGADEWARRCQRQAAALGVALEVLAVTLPEKPAEGVEAAAREARYAALAGRLGSGEVLLTAQHADDQLETFLLQALRGAGPSGLAAMPAQARLGPGWLVRPLLDCSRTELAELVAAHGLDVIVDPSNTDPALDRSYLRNEVLPALYRRWPSAAVTVSRSAALSAEAAELVESVGKVELARWLDDAGRLSAPGLLGLDPPRQHAVLRSWLAWRGLTVPSRVKLQAMITEVAGAGHARNPCLRWPGGEMRRHRQRLYAMAPLGELPGGLCLEMPRSAPLALPAGLGRLALVRRSANGALDPAQLAGRRLTVRWREGGERLVPAGHRVRRSLKDWLREQGVVPWMRARLPLFYVDDELAAVADLCVSAAFSVSANQPGFGLAWLDRPAIF